MVDPSSLALRLEQIRRRRQNVQQLIALDDEEEKLLELQAVSLENQTS
jgi:hypothetical protein